MKVFVFKPSNEFIGKFKIQNLDDMSNELRKFLANIAQPVPPYSYVETSGRTWTIVSDDPLQLAEGAIAGPNGTQRKLPPTPHDLQRAEKAKRSSKGMINAGFLLMGGGYFAFKFAGFAPGADAVAGLFIMGGLGLVIFGFANKP